MSDIHQVWEGHDGWKALGLRYFVHQDFDIQPNIEDAFDFVISARLLGPQIGSATVSPLKNQAVDLGLAAGVGSITGKIDNWQGYLAGGAKGSWTTGGLAEARFLLTLDIDVTLPVGGKVQIKAFHKPCTVLLHWDGTKKKYVYMPA